MNIFKKYIELTKKYILENKKELQLNSFNEFKGTLIELPPSEFNFDISTNVSLVLAKINKKNPKDLSIKIRNVLLSNIKDFKEIEIAGPGFLNIVLSDDANKSFIQDTLDSNEKYGSFENKKKINIEFVSANPTGPMHVGHCRGAIYGDVLANLLKFNGNKVTKEYYINDYGNQIINFTKSVFLRIREIKYNEKFTDSENLYPGSYIINIAKMIIADFNQLDFNNFENSFKLLKEQSLKHSMNMIKDDLKKLGIKHDNFFSETDIVNKKLVEKAIQILKEKEYVEQGFLSPPKGEATKNWKKSKRMIFKSTLFGDDNDRALQKDDGAWTYFANDIAYHSDKISRKFDSLVNILGADHTGYIKRITAAVKALSNEKVKLDCKVCQLVKLFKNGKPYKMSKRAGDFISANDLLEEVDKDSIRFMMLNRSNDVELEFDFDKVLEKGKDNPVFYVQYCFARINSLFESIGLDINEKFVLDENNFHLNQFEKKIIRKIFEWPKIIQTASNKYEPHRIPFYLYELATLFHSYWSKGNKEEEFKFIKEGKVNKNTLCIIKLVSIVVQNGMNILGVSLPKKM